MKTKIIAIITAAATLFCLTACQATPEQDVVVKKDNERMIEKAESGEGDTLSSLSAPEHFIHESDGADGKLHINVDADMQTPDVSAIPIIRTSMDFFTQEQVTGMFNYLFPGEKPQTVVPQTETKSVIEQEILNLKRMLSDGDYSQFSKEDLEAQIAAFEKLYQDAPESASGSVVSDGTLQVFGSEADSRLHLDVQTNDYIFSVGTVSMLTEDTINKGSIDIHYQSRANERIYIDQLGHRWELGSSDMPEDAEKKLTISYDDAKKLCDGFLAAAGVQSDFCIGDVKIVDNAVDTAADRPINYAYQFQYTRMVQGVSLFFNPQQYSATSDDDQYSFRWDYEELSIQVDNDGIASLSWTSPIRLGEMVTENAALKSFDEIIAAFDGMVNTTYGGIIKTHFNNEVNLDIDVDNIELCLMRVREKNADATDGLLVPAWVFYGSNKGTNGSGDERYFPGSYSIIKAVSDVNTGGLVVEGGRAEYSLWNDLGSTQKRDNSILFIINAVDGSIIDPTKGY